MHCCRSVETYSLLLIIPNANCFSHTLLYCLRNNATEREHCQVCVWQHNGLLTAMSRIPATWQYQYYIFCLYTAITFLIAIKSTTISYTIMTPSQHVQYLRVMLDVDRLLAYIKFQTFHLRYHSVHWTHLIISTVMCHIFLNVDIPVYSWWLVKKSNKLEVAKTMLL